MKALRNAFILCLALSPLASAQRPAQNSAQTARPGGGAAPAGARGGRAPAP
jgi:hypothetical protein